jgi:predicted GNAT family acetyltransferase
MSEVIQNQELDRFELVENGEMVGFSAYRIDGTSMTFTHTEIEPDEQEHGLGGKLVRQALDQVREHTDYRVIAQCPFVARFIADHPEYKDLTERKGEGN